MTKFKWHLLLGFCASATAAFSSDIVAENLTIANSMSMGQIRINQGVESTTVPGLRIIIEQDASNETFTNTIQHPGYTTTEEVVEHEYGWVEVGGYYQDMYGWGVVSSTWVPPVIEDQGYYDENNQWVSNPVTITEGYTQEEWGDVYLGQQWISGNQEWQVVNSYTSTVDVYHEPFTTTEEIEYQQFHRPKIKFAATRNDANWVWQVPNAAGSNTMKDVFVVFDGGVRIPASSDADNMSILADNLVYSRATQSSDSSSVVSSKTRASGVEIISDRQFSNEDEYQDKTRLEAGKLTLDYTTTVSNGSASSSARSQISADAAYFGGMVTVKENLHVQGIIRVQPAGGLSMGIYTRGQQP